MSTLDTILADATTAAQVAALSGQPVAIAAAAGTVLATDVATDLEKAQATHATTVATADAVLGTVSVDAAPVIATLSTEDQAKANGVLAAMETLWAEFKAIF